MKNLKNKKGFTLIELIVVLAILGILMLILVPSFLGYAEDAKSQVSRANARTVYTAYKAAVAKAEYATALQGNDGKADSAKVLTEAKEKLGTGYTVDYDKDKVNLTVTTSGKACTVAIADGAISGC